MLAFGIAAAFAAILVASWLSGRVNVRAGSKEVDGPPVRITHIAKSYRLNYEITTYAQKKPTVTTERVWVKRPFDSRIETWRGPAPGTSRLSVRLSRFGVLTSESSSAAPLRLAIPPSVAAGDLRVDAAVGDAVKRDVVVRRERREVYGRPCQVYRAGDTILAGDIQRYKNDPKNYADFCIDRNGLVIEEMWYSKGALLRRRVARMVKIAPRISSSVFEAKVKETPGIDPGEIERVDRTSVGRHPLWALPKTPKGFTNRGRYGVRISSAAVPQSSQLFPVSGPASTTDVYTRGADLLLVDQDPSLASYVRSDSRPKEKVKLGRLRNGVLIVDARMSEVRGETEDGSFVRVLGTLPPSELLKIARGLRPLGA